MPISRTPPSLEVANANTLGRLHQTLAELFARMEQSRDYGRVVVEVSFEEGRAVKIAKANIEYRIKL